MKHIKYLHYIIACLAISFSSFLHAVDSDEEAWVKVKSNSSKKKEQSRRASVASASSSRRSSISARSRYGIASSATSSRFGSPRPASRDLTCLQNTDTYLASIGKQGTLNPKFKAYGKFPRTRDLDKIYLNQFFLRLSDFQQGTLTATDEGKPYTLGLGEKSLTMLREIKEKALWVLFERPQERLYVGMIVEGAKIVRQMDLLRLKSNDYFDQVIQSMCNFVGNGGYLIPFNPINAFLSLSNVMNVPIDERFHKLINDKLNEIEKNLLFYKMRPRLHIHTGSFQESDDDISFDYDKKIRLFEQDLLAAVVIAYQMMPDEDYAKIRTFFHGRDAPLEKALRVIQQMEMLEVGRGKSLFAPKLLQRFHWSLLIEKHKKPNSVNDGFMAYIARQFKGQARSIRSGAEYRIKGELEKAVVNISSSRTAPFYDVYERVAEDDPTYKSLNLFTEIDFVFRPKRGDKKNFIFFEVDGPHHFVRDLETYGQRPETMTGQTHIKTKLLLQRGKVVRMSLMCQAETYNERLSQMPQIIHECGQGYKKFALVDPENYPVNYQDGGVRKKAVPNLRDEEEFPSL